LTIFKQFNSIWFLTPLLLLPKSNSKILSTEAFFFFFTHYLRGMKPTQSQITQLLFFNIPNNRWWAFKQMGISFNQLQSIEGLSFFKMLGTGGGQGFSLRPDFSTYVFLGVWESEEYAIEFLSSSFVNEYKKRTSSIREIRLSNIHSHGKWSGINPFKSIQPEYDIQHKIAVITRATLNWNRLFQFWKSVPQASKAIENAKGVRFFKGIGEWPFIQQATVSIWDSIEDVYTFAYKSHAHADIVKKTHQQKWYKEDLFSRFIVQLDTEF